MNVKHGLDRSSMIFYILKYKRIYNKSNKKRGKVPK